MTNEPPKQLSSWSKELMYLNMHSCHSLEEVSRQSQRGLLAKSIMALPNRQVGKSKRNSDGWRFPHLSVFLLHFICADLSFRGSETPPRGTYGRDEAIYMYTRLNTEYIYDWKTSFLFHNLLRLPRGLTYRYRRHIELANFTTRRFLHA